MHFSNDDDDLMEPDYRAESQKCIEPIKVIYYALQVILFTIGFVMLYYGAAVRQDFIRTGPEEALTPLILVHLDTAIIVIGVLVMVYGIYGVLTVALRNKVMSTVYICGVLMVIFGTIYTTWWIQRQFSFIQIAMPTIWAGLGEASRSRLQALGTCCGFRHPRDQAAPPCPVGALTGCFPMGMASPLLDWLRGTLLLSLTLVFALGFVLCILNIFIVFVHEPRRQVRKILLA